MFSGLPQRQVCVCNQNIPLPQEVDKAIPQGPNVCDHLWNEDHDFSVGLKHVSV